MKTKFTRVWFCFVLSSFFSIAIYSCQDKPDCRSTENPVGLRNKDHYVVYQGGEVLNFLHNNTDTHSFIGQGRETYYVHEEGDGNGDCDQDYESIRVKFLNSKTSDLFVFSYERDRLLFKDEIAANSYTFFKIGFKEKLFYTRLPAGAIPTVVINGKTYNGYFIGNDTNNYIGYAASEGIFRIRINGENWDIIK